MDGLRHRWEFSGMSQRNSREDIDHRRGTQTKVNPKEKGGRHRDGKSHEVESESATELPLVSHRERELGEVE